MSEVYCYCPRCGHIRTSEYVTNCNYCIKDISFFDRKEIKKTKLIKTDIKVRDDVWNITEPHFLNRCTEEIARHVWENYVDIPENDKLNREAHEKLKAYYLDYLNNGGYKPSDIYDPRKFNSDSKSNKDASVVGRAVAGGVIAGPVGAVVGAASAIDKNMKNKK